MNFSSSDLERLEILSQWTGFADPPVHAAKLTIRRSGAGFLREQPPAGPTEELPTELVSQLLEALACPAVPQLDPALFDFPEAVLQAHYGSVWTDDHPAHLVRMTFANGRVVTLRAEAQQAFMLPLKVADPAQGVDVATFDPRLSQAIAALMPEGYLEKERLAGQLGLLQYDLERFTRGEDDSATLREPAPLADDASADAPPKAQDQEAIRAELFRILSRTESAEDEAKAEQAGKLSERLLKRNSLKQVRNLLARGANPSIADEHGQTALMLAAWPPVDRERFRLLVQAGADVHARSCDGFSGLHLSCAGGMHEATEEWVRAGADVNARTPEGATPLMLGASWLGVVQALLDVGADVNAVDRDGHSALVSAILKQCWVNAEQQLEALRALLAARAAINHRDHEGITPLGHARRVLARVQLQEEVCRAFNPDHDPSRGREWDDRRMAEAVVNLIAAAGGRE
jgi:hypothetical protein